MRREPSQLRGRLRVDRILDAAAAEFAAAGFDSATTNAIAARAGMSVGSIYQFFGDKQAILDALTDKYLADLAGLAGQAASPPDGASLDEVLAPVIEGLMAYGARNPEFLALFAAPPGQSGHGRSGARMRQVVRMHVERLLAHKGLPGPRLVITATVCTEIIRAILPMAVTADADSAELATHLRAALGGYLAVIEAAPRGPAAAGGRYP